MKTSPTIQKFVPCEPRMRIVTRRRDHGIAHLKILANDAANTIRRAVRDGPKAERVRRDWPLLPAECDADRRDGVAGERVEALADGAACVLCALHLLVERGDVSGVANDELEDDVSGP
jgi:hypothetical protein